MGDFLDTKHMVREQHAIFTTLTLLLLTKGIAFIVTTWENFRIAISMAVELSGLVSMLTVTSLTWLKRPGVSSKERMLMEDSIAMACCGTTKE